MPKLVNLGSLCIDNVYQVPNISRPGETVASTDHAIYPGGKGLNQSLAAARAGATVAHFGCIGPDGHWLKQLLDDAGVRVDGIRVVAGGTGHASIQVDPRGANAIVIVGGANRTLTMDDVNAAVAATDDGDWLLLQNEINDLERVLAAAADSGVNVALNVAPVDGREQGYDLSGVDLLIVNAVEAAAITQRDRPDAAIEALRSRYAEMQIALTLGAAGLVYADANERFTLPAFAVNAVDETAAGDAFIGYLMAAKLAGRDAREALRVASVAGALAVTQHGAASSIPERGAVEAYLASAS